MSKNQSKKNVPSTYIKSPFDLIKAPIDWSILESKILLAIMSSLQDRFQRYYEGDANGQLSLFEETEFDEHDEVTMNIGVKELSINPKHYDQLESACRHLSEIIVPVIEKDKNGALVEMYRQVFAAGMNIEINNEQKYVEYQQRQSVGDDSINIPWKRGRKTNNLIIKISRSIADNYFRGGNFSVHLRNIAHNCKCSYTPHLYMYLSKFREFKKETTLTYEELRKMVGMYKYDKFGNKINGRGEIDEKGMYPRFKDFEKRVLLPVKNELDTLFEEGNVDLKFEYDLIYKDKPRGNPLKVHFKVISISKDECLKILNENSAKEEQNISTVSDEEFKRWNDLAILVSSQNSTWWNTFGRCCSSGGIKNHSLIIKVPSSFVAEKWNEHVPFLRQAIKKIWGTDKFEYEI